MRPPRIAKLPPVRWTLAALSFSTLLAGSGCEGEKGTLETPPGASVEVTAAAATTDRDVIAEFGLARFMNGGTGVVLGNRWVLTTTHVLTFVSSFGQSSEVNFDPGQNSPVTRVMAHPLSSPGSDAYDAGLVRLRHPFRIGSSYNGFRRSLPADSAAIPSSLTCMGFALAGPFAQAAPLISNLMPVK